MTTVMAVYSSDGRCIGRCDSSCHDATSKHCTCICGGANHGKGAEQAIQNTAQHVEEYLKDTCLSDETVLVHDAVKDLRADHQEVFGEGFPIGKVKPRGLRHKYRKVPLPGCE